MTILLTSGVVAGFFFHQEQKQDREIKHLISELLESHHRIEKFSKHFSDRGFVLRSLADNKWDNEKASADLAKYISLNQKIIALSEKSEDFAEVYALDSQYDNLIDEVTTWEYYADQVLDMRVKKLVALYRSQDLFENLLPRFSGLESSVQNLKNEILLESAITQKNLSNKNINNQYSNTQWQKIQEVAQTTLLITDQTHKLSRNISICENQLHRLANVTTNDAFQEILDQDFSPSMLTIDGHLFDLSLVLSPTPENASHISGIKTALEEIRIIALGVTTPPYKRGYVQYQANFLEISKKMESLLPELDSSSARIGVLQNDFDNAMNDASSQHYNNLEHQGDKHRSGGVLLGFVIAFLSLAMTRMISHSIERIQLKEKANSRELAHSKKRFSDIARSSGDWVWETNRKGVFTFVTGNTQSMLNFDPEEILGRSYTCMVDSEDQRRIKRILLSLARFQEPIVNLEFWLVTNRKDVVPVQINGVPTTDENGRLLGYRGSVKDITAEFESREGIIKAKEESDLTNLELEKAALRANDMAMSAEAANAAKSEFLATMSHEIRTP
ncbi:MAG: PAS domain S-box protein, partial [bacterium]|nr:PAS domain S-box protein [bacterium]